MAGVIKGSIINTSNSVHENARAYLQRLCVEIPTRTVGTQGNRQACEFFESTAASFGFTTRRQEFDCLDWSSWHCGLAVDGTPFEVFASPYSLAEACLAPLHVVTTLDELRAAPQDTVLLMRGEIAKEPLMPKGYPFYYPDEHKEIHTLLEQKHPAMIVTATERHPQTAGAAYPSPMIEDGSFHIPSMYMSAEEGLRLAGLAGRKAAASIHAKRRQVSGFNPLANICGSGDKRVALSAHIDAKPGTPGALDNAAGVTVLLLVAEMLQGYDGRLGVELVPFNGEDHYSAAGEMAYLADAQTDLEHVVLNINIDAVGYHGGWTEYSMYGCPEPLHAILQPALAEKPMLKAGQAWPQGDHMVFMQHGIPALALTSNNFVEILTKIAHTGKDVPELVDIDLLIAAAQTVSGVIHALNAAL